MGFIIYMTIKLCWKLLLVEVWLCWAMIVLLIALIASVTGHRHTAQQWMRSLNWRHVF